ncbi:MAG: precorrin-8X methylmutase [Geminicoccaceae bacterium]
MTPGDAHGAYRPRYAYQRDPAAIYRESFAIVERETPWDHVPADVKGMVRRLIHACGMVDLATDIRARGNVTGIGRAAIADGHAILCDAAMVAAGITRSRFATPLNIINTLRADATVAHAQRLATTRSAAAVELWHDHLDGAVVAIGNAPTALFHLLERLHGGWPKPAVILAFPVGFVGAAESKQALIEADLGIPFLTVCGRRGGSALAAAAVNALGDGEDDA